MYGNIINTNNIEVAAVLCFAVALRSIISLYSYSGANRPPLHGDYEAQRHWQEITINLPIKEWYRNTSNNDLLYWGLDYPPLTAYHSYAIGSAAKFLNHNYVALEKSRGYESNDHKSFMRLTVLLCDILLYLPALLFLGVTLRRRFNQKWVLPFITIAGIYPGQILIDNGHFQYNNVSLALAALAISAILRRRYYLAAFCFTLALNYKQMELYHALPIFVFLLHICVTQKSFLEAAKKLFIIGGIVVVTFIILWLPWLDSIDSVLILLRRLFPIDRGVFEDKVANFWCAANVVYKIKKIFTNQQMALVCLITTTAFVFPLNAHLFARLNEKKFLYALTSTALAFFLFSFQVHEKSILLAALPAFCLLTFQPIETVWFLMDSVFSMFPLLNKDGLAWPFFLMLGIFHLVVRIIYADDFHQRERKNQYLKFYVLLTLVQYLLSLVCIFVPPPNRYPFLWPLLISLFSCLKFIAFLLQNLYAQIFTV